MDKTTLSDFASACKIFARPFTQYVITIAFAVGMFFHIGVEVLTLAASLLAWHGYLRSQDKKNGDTSDLTGS